MLGSLGSWVRDVITTAGYPGLAALTLIENLFPPIPSEVILPLAGFYVGRGDLGFVLAVLSSTLGSVLGALIIYAIARRGGRRALLRHPRLVRVDEARLDRVEVRFAQYGNPLVFFGRLVPGLRSVVSIPAGLARMPVPRFITLTLAGSALWNSALIAGGWALGSQYAHLSAAVGDVSTVVTVLLVLALIGLSLLWWRRRSGSR